VALELFQIKRATQPGDDADKILAGHGHNRLRELANKTQMCFTCRDCQLDGLHRQSRIVVLVVEKGNAPVAVWETELAQRVAREDQFAAPSRIAAEQERQEHISQAPRVWRIAGKNVGHAR
jgi:hypothetical protein